MRNNTPEVATVILAGGRGKRLLPLTLHHSKPAIAYGGRYRLIDIPISNSINSDFRQIFVIAQYLTSELEHYIHQTYYFDSYHPGSVDVLTPQMNEKGEKEWFQGTADAVRKSLPTLLKSTAAYFLILSGDQLYNIDFQKMLKFAQSKNADLTIASLPVLEKDARRMGLLKINKQRVVTDFVEKPKKKKILKSYELSESFYKHCKFKPHKKHSTFLGSMGIYIFKRKALIDLLKTDKREDFGYHLIGAALKKMKTYSYIFCGYWEDIGTVASYYEANLMLTRLQASLNTYDERNPIYARPTFLPGPKITKTQINQSIICEGCVIEAKEISNSVIGLRSRIKSGTIIRDSVLMGNHFYMPPIGEKDLPSKQEAWIGTNCLIEKAIIDEHVQIGNRVKLINKKRYKHYNGKQLYVRDGIIIVTSGAKLPNNFVF